MAGQGNNPMLRKALDESYVTLNLTPTIHDFEFDDMGRVTFNIDYLAYIEEAFNQPPFNIFANAKMCGGEPVALNRMRRHLEIQTLNKKCGAGSEEINKKKEQYGNEIAAETAVSIGSLIQKLSVKDRLYYLTLTSEQVSNFSLSGPSKEYQTIKKLLKDQINAAIGGAEPAGSATAGLLSSGTDYLSGDLEKRVADSLSAFEEGYRGIL